MTPLVPLIDRTRSSGFHCGEAGYYHTDALGSVRAVTKLVNGQLVIVSRHDFMPFGEEVNPPNPPTDKRLFTGQERDAETGLDYFNARQLAAGYGRFTTVDPLGQGYTYVSNNPLRFVDPTGLYIVKFPSSFPPAGPFPDSTTVVGTAGAMEMVPLWPLAGLLFGGGGMVADPTAGGTDGATGGAIGAAPQVKKAVPTPTPCSVQPATGFILANKGDAATLAQEMNAKLHVVVPTNFVLAMAGDESKWGTSNIARGANNYFGLWAGAPGAIGPWSGNPIVAAFPPGDGFLISGQSYVKVATPLLSQVNNPSDPTAFFTAMHHKFGLGDTLRQYLDKMTGPKGTAAMTAFRMNCR